MTSMRGSLPTRGDNWLYLMLLFFFQAEDGIRDLTVTGVQTCALPIFCNLACTSTNKFNMAVAAAAATMVAVSAEIALPFRSTAARIIMRKSIGLRLL